MKLKQIFLKFKQFIFEHKSHIYLIFVVLIALFGVWIRIQNWNYIYGKKLSSEPDTYLFYRYAKYIVENGTLPRIDIMRYYPLGFNTLSELQMVPIIESILYYLLSPMNISLLETAALYPPVIFFLIVIVFFFVVKELTRKDSIALLASLILVVMPFSIQRTSLGFADKEPIATLFIFLALYFYIKAKKSKKNSLENSLLAGLFTLLGLLSWGGTKYLILTLGFSELIYSLKDLDHKERLRTSLIQLYWLLPWFILAPLFTTRYSYESFILNPIYAVAFAGIVINLFVLLLEKIEDLRLYKKKIENKQWISFGILIIAGLGMFIYLRGTKVLIDLILRILYPLGYSRFAISVAENRPLQIGEWQVMLPLFLVFLVFIAVYNLIGYRKDSSIYQRIIDLVSILSIGGYSLVISRFPHSEIFLVFLFISMACLIIQAWMKSEFSFEKIYLLSFLLLTLLGARGAARLAYLVSYTLPIFYAIGIYYVSNLLSEKFEIPKYADYTKATISLLLSILIIGVPGIPIGLKYYEISLALAKAQKGLDSYWYVSLGWVKDNTEKNSIFAHWWDYGYLVQTIGERTTILDGGNVIVFWDHLFGRHVLCGKSLNESLEFLYAHSEDGKRPVYLLIDPSDVYKAYQFSRIGSDQFLDRWMKIGVYVPIQKKEVNNKTVILLVGDAAMVDEPIKIRGRVISVSSSPTYYYTMLEIVLDNQTGISDAYAYIGTTDSVYAKIPIRYLAMKVENETRIIEINRNGKGMIYAVPAVYIDATTGEISTIGQGFIYLTDKAINYTWVRLYFLGDYKENFEEVYEYSPGLLKEHILVLYDPATGGIYHLEYRGPLKIWKVHFPENYTISKIMKCVYNSRSFSEVIKKCNATWYKNELEV